MCWSIEYYSSKVEKEILSFPSGILARYLRLADLMIEFGPNLGLPHTKYIKDGLIELRVKSKEGAARIFYCTIKGEKITVLHSFIKKSNKIPKKELEIAQKRMNRILRK